MKKCIVNNGEFECVRETQAELDAWKSKQITKGLFSTEDITFEGDDPEGYAKKRQEEYSKIDQMRIEAMVEKELGDSTKWNEYIALRNAIKVANPKPE